MLTAKGEKEACKFDAIVLKKLVVLLDYYAIDQDDPEKWFYLSLSLARDQFEGFAEGPKKGRGRNVEWTPEREALLVVEVKARKKRLGSYTQCVKEISTEEPWLTFLARAKWEHSHKALPEDALYGRFKTAQRKADNTLVRILRKARLYYEANDGLDCWYKLITEEFGK